MRFNGSTWPTIGKEKENDIIRTRSTNELPKIIDFFSIKKTDKRKNRWFIKNSSRSESKKISKEMVTLKNLKLTSALPRK